MGSFKRKKRFNNFIIYMGLFFISIAFTIKYLYQENLINNDTIVDILINDHFGSFKKEITDVDFLLNYILNVNLDNDEMVYENDNNNEKIEIDKNDINKDSDKPVVYIYNTHQEEKYQSIYLEEYNISSTVLVASKILKEYLEDLGVYSIVEESNVTDTLHSLNWKYGSSYKVSRMFMEDAKKKNPTLKYFIDLHRDSSKYDKTTIDINGEKYARLLFVVGLDNPNYEPNLKFAEILKKKINNYNSSFFRGIMKKSGKGVNGVYNQDFDPNTILIEVGGQYNNIREVNNTLRVLAQILAQYIKEDIND